jgi:hypothetical protein
MDASRAVGRARNLRGVSLERDEAARGTKRPLSKRKRRRRRLSNTLRRRGEGAMARR